MSEAVGMLIVDSREQDEALKGAADAVKFLSYPNEADPGHPFSYDIEIHTAGGQVLRGERKRGDDAVASFLAGKLDRQCSAVDFLVVEFSELALEMAAPAGDAARRAWFQKVEGCKKHLARLALSMPVIQTSGVKETVAILRYLCRQVDLSVFRNGVAVKAPSAREKLVRSLSPSIDSAKFQEIWPLIDKPALAAALRVDRWPISPVVIRRIIADLGTPEAFA